MRGSWVVSSLVAKVGYAAACLGAAVLLVVSGYAHKVVGLTNAIEGGASIGGGPSVGAMNILLMGLESRTDFEGNTLSAAQLATTHSGSTGGTLGAQDTDTLILIHVFAGGQKAVGYSIPRDDVVNYPHTSDGVTEGKIDGAYNYAYTQYVSDNYGKMSTDALYQGANAAGQVFQVQTVESVTGVHIDHFVVSNIYGFELIAQELGGIEVCLKPAPKSIEPPGLGFGFGANLVDLPYAGANFGQLSNSGFNAIKYDGYNPKDTNPQYLHLAPPQALAFVRARDSLPGVDIGRTHRQQAAIDYIIYDLKNRNILTDPTVISSLLSGAASYLKTDSGFSLLDFAPEMRSLTGSNLSLATLPDAAVQGIYIPAFGDHPQDANYIYVPSLQKMVNQAFYGSAAPTASKSVTVDVYNGSGTPGLAGGASQAFASQGYATGKAENATAQKQTVTGDTQVFYGAGAAAAAGSIANEVGATTSAGDLGASELDSLPAGHVEVLLGSTVGALPAGLETYGGYTVTAQDFITAAEQNNLPASDFPAGTDPNASKSASPSAAHSQAPTTSTTKPAAKASASSTAIGHDDQAVPAGAKYGIPCVY